MQKQDKKSDFNEDARQKIKENKKGWEKVQIPSRWVDGNFPFNFSTYIDKNIGIIFFITGLIVPFFSGLVLRLAFSLDGGFSDGLGLINLAISIVSNGIGFFIIWDKRRSLMFKTTLFMYYAYVVLPIVLSLLLSPIGFLGIPDYWTSSILLLIQAIVLLTLIYWVFSRVDELKSRVYKTLKQNFKMLLLVAAIGAASIFILSLIYGTISSALGFSQNNSENQESLVRPLTQGNLGSQILYIISLFVFTVIVAPLMEEIVFRDGVFTGASNRWIGWIMSAVLFAYIHISATGDFEHLLEYLIAGIVLATAFNICRGNVTYTWFIHATSNLISFIMILVSVYAIN
ncbi:CPBP family intramembrane glutamic endopeptidase [Spiroplasma alleghenense]|uniref:CAAX amino terminal membrane bound protease n=1 Tax=Spiroplasma alleghenense TaxID=216931 RepID=A0A345Z2F5_9MOLU|nr:type II CAAX endopeptidase family protein [Spiroplasma alleghenense]AXK50784.1 CAAX amino terminal membrane bound protease [Spiroplasma alleghenense]